MVTFIVGLLILLVGYIFYSKYVEKQFTPQNCDTPAIKMADGVDYIELSPLKTRLLQLLNIAGIAPILGGIQGILFGPIAFILIPLGAIFAGSVHDYFAGMISVRNNGAQITELIKKYLGQNAYKVFIGFIIILLVLVTIVFVYTTGDLVLTGLFKQTDLSLSNPYIIAIYAIIALYYIVSAILPIDKILGRFYPMLGIILLLGTLLIVVGFITKGVNLTELDFTNINLHPKNLPLIPIFFVTISCGVLSGFHSTQATMMSRTIKTEYEGRQTFFKMMCYESLIAMIWAAGAMSVYNLSLVPQHFIGTPEVINNITSYFLPLWLTFMVTLGIIVLPITTGDTALRALRLIIADMFKIEQKSLKKRVLIMIPTILVLITGLILVKIYDDNFALIWRYFMWCNQVIALPTLFLATKFLYDKKKNYFITLIPAIFYTFIMVCFILNAKIGFGLPINISYSLTTCLTVILLVIFRRKILLERKI